MEAVTALAPIPRRLLADTDADADWALSGLRQWAQRMAEHEGVTAAFEPMLDDAGIWNITLQVAGLVDGPRAGRETHLTGAGRSFSIVQACAEALGDLGAVAGSRLEGS